MRREWERGKEALGVLVITVFKKREKEEKEVSEGHQELKEKNI